MTGDPQLQVLVVDDEPDMLAWLGHVLRQRGGLAVAEATDADAALAAYDRSKPDVVVTDIRMPGMSGLELLSQLRERSPQLPVVVITAYTSLDLVIDALRGQADEFLRKPLDPTELVATVTRLGESARDRAATGRRTVLAVGAHPDDVEIGVGGLLCAHHARGDRIGIVTLARGVRGGATESRRSGSQSAAELVDARLFLEDLTDTMVPVGDPTVGIIQGAIEQLRPDTVYTHSVSDVHQDHRAANQATMVAARGVPTVACYQSPSSAVGFRPNRFAAIDDYLAGKLELIRCFSSQAETRDYLESDLIVATARYWSRFGTGRYAEPLEVVRDRTTAAGPPMAAERPEGSHAH